MNNPDNEADKDTSDLVESLEAIITYFSRNHEGMLYLAYCSYLRETIDKIESLTAQMEELAREKKWIDIAGGIKCPNCDDSGGVVVEYTRAEAGCCGQLLPTGECCGNAIPIPVATQELQQCQFCYECPDSIFNRSIPPLPNNGELQEKDDG